MNSFIGRILRNRYEILELLGEGSTATVYRARDRRLGREVALKILLPHVKDSVRKRFMQEANAAARLNHPNIMAIYDADEDDRNPFLVVEFVQGEPLTRFIPSAPDLAVNFGVQIANALHYAHERGIIHRDIKPANIKVTPEGVIKIMDLGLALPPDAKRVTADGMIIGTPAYLSPEQAQGLDLDRRTDIYSLGIVMYELLCGELPFITDDIPALMLQHIKTPPRPLTEVNPNIPPALERVILKAIEKLPGYRFQTAEAFAQAMHAALYGGSGEPPASAARPGTGKLGVPADDRVTADAPATRPRPPIRIIVADDHTMLRRTLVNYLSTRDDIMVIGEAADGDEALRQVAALTPDVLILDLNMPGKGGLDVLPAVRREHPKVRVLVVTGRDEDWYITQALRAGAHGYILKSASEADLIDAIQKVHQGTLVLGSGVAEKVVTGMLRGGDQTSLTDDERLVLLLVAAGYENEGIAKRTGRSLAFVIETLAQAMNKLKARDRHDAALIALRNGYILIDELHRLQQGLS